MLSDAQRIEAFKRHPILNAVLAEVPDTQRDVILRCIFSSKREFPLPDEEESEAFSILADAATAHIAHIIQQVIDALDA